MKRWWFNLTAAVSFLVAAAAVIGAVRSPFVWDTWLHETLVNQPDGSQVVATYMLHSGSGSLELGRSTFSLPAGLNLEQSDVQRSHYEHTTAPANGPKFGILQRLRRTGSSGVAGLMIPWWSLALAASILPGWWLRRRHLLRRRSNALCPACGYDLRATPERCPDGKAAAATP